MNMDLLVWPYFCCFLIFILIIVLLSIYSDMCNMYVYIYIYIYIYK